MPTSIGEWAWTMAGLHSRMAVSMRACSLRTSMSSRTPTGGLPVSAGVLQNANPSTTSCGVSPFGCWADVTAADSMPRSRWNRMM